MSTRCDRAWCEGASETSRRERRGKRAAKRNTGRCAKKSGDAHHEAGCEPCSINEQPCNQPSSGDSWKTISDVPQGIREIWGESAQRHIFRSSSLASGHSTSSTASADTLDNASAVASLPFTPQRRDMLLERELAASAWKPDPLACASELPWSVGIPPGLETNDSDPSMWVAYDSACTGFDTCQVPWDGNYSAEWDIPMQGVDPFSSYNPGGHLHYEPPPPPPLAAPQMFNAYEAPPPPEFQASVPRQPQIIHAGFSQRHPDLPLRSPVRFEGCPTRAPASTLEQIRFRSILSKAGLL